LFLSTEGVYGIFLNTACILVGCQIYEIREFDALTSMRVVICAYSPKHDIHSLALCVQVLVTEAYMPTQVIQIFLGGELISQYLNDPEGQSDAQGRYAQLVEKYGNDGLVKMVVTELTEDI
jgi:hypothetical protein